MRRLLIAMLASVLVLAPATVRAAPESLLSFDGNTGWINSAPLGPAQLQGKIVLVDFWEYTCVNCLRTLPYLREWYKRYAADGFVIVGVHTPEFTFSGDAKNVEAAVKRLDVTWPVVMDSNNAIWTRYGNNVWPHEMLFAQNGQRVEDVMGEGNYPATEAKIQALIKKANPNAQLPPLMALLPQDSYDKPGAVCYPETEETYLGVGQRNKIANMPPAMNHEMFDQRTDPFHGLQASMEFYDNSSKHQDGDVYLQGAWRIPKEGAISADGRGRVSLVYHAIEVMSVLRPENGPVTVGVTQDGKPVPREDAGADLKYDAQGNSYLTVNAPRGYEVIMNKKWGTHELQLYPKGGGLGVYTFAFESCEAGSDK